MIKQLPTDVLQHKKVFLKTFWKTSKKDILFKVSFGSFGQVADPLPAIALNIIDFLLRTVQKFPKRLLSGRTFSDNFIEYVSFICPKSENYVECTLKKEI